MDKSKHTKPSPNLLARLHAACRPSYSSNAFAMRVQQSGDYLVEAKDRVPKRSTLGESINYNPQNA